LNVALPRRVILGLIVAGYLILATLYAIRVPPWNAPDEPAHYNFIYSIAIQHQLPVLQPGDYSQAAIDRLTNLKFPPSESIAAFRYESHQPPLYYLLAAPVLVITRAQSVKVQVVALRLVTVVIGAALLLAVDRLARQIFPKSGAIPLAATAFVAFVPEHIFMNAAIDNDALAELMLCLTLIVLVDDLRAGGRARNDWLAGVVAGLAILTKLVAAVSAVLVALGFLGTALLAPDRRQALRQLPLRLARSGSVAVVLSGWWVARNLVIYGVKDPFGLRRHAQVVVGQKLTGGLSLPLLRQMSLTLFHSFWGQFGWMGIPFADRTYDVIATASVLVAIGILAFAWRVLREAGVGDWVSGVRDGVSGKWPRPSDIRHPTPDTQARIFSAALGLLVAEMVLVLLGVVFYNLQYLQPQGRYLFPTLPALGIFAAAGIAELFRDRYVPLALTVLTLGLAWLAVFSLFQVIGPAFASTF
jgi:4-amino-4-deoxy-L-arabinose transferase-like glycosyltransferase